MIKILNIQDKNGYEFMHGYYEVLAELPDNYTNGDIIKALFPKAEIHDWYKEDEYIDIYGVDYEALIVCRKWWNAPYRREDTPKCDTCTHKSKGFEFCDGCVDNDLYVREE